MAVLTEADRARIWRGFMRHESGRGSALGLTKPDLRAAVDATDDWIEANAASYNAALPQPARGALTQEQKALLFMAVTLTRYNVEAPRRLFGEVD